MLRADAVEGAAEPGLEVAEDGVRPRQDVQSLTPVAALARAVIDPELAQGLVGAPGVGEDRGLVGSDRVLHERGQHRLRRPGNHDEAHGPCRLLPPLDGDRDPGLAHAAAVSPGPIAADVGLVDLDVSLEREEGIVRQGGAHLGQQPPGRLVAA